MRRRVVIMWLGILALAAILWGNPLRAEDASLTIGNYQLVSSKRINLITFEYVYKATISNTGEDVINVSANLTTGSPYISVIEGVLSFGSVAAGASIPSIDTFTVRHDRRGPFDVNALLWNISSQSAAPLLARFNATPTTGNAPLKVTFAPDVVTTMAINRYQWDLDGNGTFEYSDTVGRNYTYTYTIPGTYQPKLLITDSINRQDTQTVTVVVANAPPVVTASAQPSNGQVPLSVNFTVSATDNEGIGKYEWDFEGDGIYDQSSTTSGNTSHIYTTVGTYYPKLRVSDKLGVSTVYAVPATEVQAAPPGSPTVTLNANPSTGNAPLAVNFSTTINNSGGSSIVQYEIDFTGDGTFDFTSSATGSASYSYTVAGTYFPRLRVTNAAGYSSVDSVQVSVKQNVGLSVSTDTIDTAAGGTSTVITTLGAATNAGIVIEKRGGGVVRTLVPLSQRDADTYNDIWDGKNDGGVTVAEGDYYAVLLYEFEGVMQRYDLALTTGGGQYNPSRTRIGSSFAPFANAPMVVDITLAKASEVDAFIGRFNVNTRLVTLLQRVPLGKGTHRLTWNGDNGEGQMIKPPSGDSFLFGLWGYYLPNNAIFVRSGAHVTGLSVSPSIYDPTSAPGCNNANLSNSTFTLNKPATIELVVTDVDAGQEVARLQYPGIPAGQSTIAWDGKNNNGTLVAPGRYRLGLSAVDTSGYRSMTVYALQRIYY